MSAPWWPAAVQGLCLSPVGTRHLSLVSHINCSFGSSRLIPTDRLQLFMFVKNINVWHHPVVVTDQSWSRSSRDETDFLTDVLVLRCALRCSRCRNMGALLWGSLWGQSGCDRFAHQRDDHRHTGPLAGKALLKKYRLWLNRLLLSTHFYAFSVFVLHFCDFIPPNKALSVQWKACGHATNGLWRK